MTLPKGPSLDIFPVHKEFSLCIGQSVTVTNILAFKRSTSVRGVTAELLMCCRQRFVLQAAAGAFCTDP